MARFLFRLLFWVVFLGIIWLAGDRYGAPSMITNVTDKGFSFVCEHVCSAWEQVMGEGE